MLKTEKNLTITVCKIFDFTKLVESNWHLSELYTLSNPTSLSVFPFTSVQISDNLSTTILLYWLMGINLYVLSIPFVSIKSVNKILKFICILPTLCLLRKSIPFAKMYINNSKNLTPGVNPVSACVFCGNWNTQPFLPQTAQSFDYWAFLDRRHTVSTVLPLSHKI